jgi:hypothetical protein
MAEWQNGRMAEWRNGRMTEWWNGGMAERRNDGMMEWRNGGMAEWWNGGMAEWHNVRYEIVENQDTESTQMPPWRSPSWLVISECLYIRNQNFDQRVYFNCVAVSDED